MKINQYFFIFIHLFCFALASSATPQQDSKPSLAVLCFDNNTGDEDLEYLSCGLSEWIISDLNQSKHLTVLDRWKTTHSEVTHVANGSYGKVNGNLVISVTLRDSRSGKTIHTTKAECAALEEIPPFVDKLTVEIKAALNLTRDQSDDRLDTEVGRITTLYPEAFRHYLDGRKYHHEGRSLEAVSAYQKALEIDPDFALAYWRMGMAFRQHAFSDYAKKSIALDSAMNLPDRLSARDHCSVRGDFHSMTRYRYGWAMEAYRELLDLYPDDVLGKNGLGLLYFNIEEWEKAASQFRVVLEAGEEQPTFYLNLARAYMNPGLYDEAQNVLETYLNRIGDNVNIYLSLVQVHRFRGDYDLAHQIADKAIALYPNVASCFADKGDIYLYSGNLDKAEIEYQKLIDDPTPEFHALGLYRLAELRLLQGRLESSRDLAAQGFEQAQKRGGKGTIRDRLSFSASMDALTGRPREAIEKLDALWETTLEDEELEWQRWVVYRKGLVHAEAGQIDRALEEAEKLEGLIAKGLDRKKMRLFLHLMGVIELERKNYKEAVEYLEKCLPMISARSRLNIAVADSLASAYSGIGDRAKARKEYERMVTFPRGRQFYGDVYALSFYRLGNSYEAEGLKDRAIEYYEKFLDIWSDADPVIPELESARRQLIDLKAR